MIFFDQNRRIIFFGFIITFILSLLLIIIIISKKGNPFRLSDIYILDSIEGKVFILLKPNIAEALEITYKSLWHPESPSRQYLDCLDL